MSKSMSAAVMTINVRMARFLESTMTRLQNLYTCVLAEYSRLALNTWSCIIVAREKHFQDKRKSCTKHVHAHGLIIFVSLYTSPLLHAGLYCRVVVAQWSEHLQLRLEALGSIPSSCPGIFSLSLFDLLLYHKFLPPVINQYSYNIIMYVADAPI